MPLASTTREGRHRGAHATAAREWGRQGITANAIAPGVDEARAGLRGARSGGLRGAMAARPIGCLGDPETDIAPVALFLASDESQFPTGQVLTWTAAHLG
jgi:NAD(P)-dependent dehydrogenase (short-subunit alcohol dehydrogenase family)